MYMTEQQKERIKNWKIHPSQRGYFAYELYKQMAKNEDIWLICLDLGYGIFDHHIKDFPGRAISVGASEQAGMDIAVGLALKGKIPFVYSITPFLLRRPYETLKLYLDEEKIPVKLVGSGRDKDYMHDGPSHYATDAPELLKTLPNIKTFFPDTKEQVPQIVKQMVEEKTPAFISLKR